MQAPNQLYPSHTDAGLLHNTVREAGELALKRFNQGTKSWDKEDGSPVSQADLDVCSLLRNRLCSSRPDYGWLSEEDADDFSRLDKEFVWIADPIDGTSSFVEGGDKWSVAVALLHHGRPVVASILRPLTGEHYQATAGGGAHLNGEAINVSHRSELPGARVIAYRKALQSKRWLKTWPEMQHGMATSLALRLCLVASGAYDAAVSIGLKHDWDLAAGDLIVGEAGGVVSDFAGEPLQYNRRQTRQNGLVACNNALHQDVVSHTSTFK